MLPVGPINSSPNYDPGHLVSSFPTVVSKSDLKRDSVFPPISSWSIPFLRYRQRHRRNPPETKSHFVRGEIARLGL